MNDAEIKEVAEVFRAVLAENGHTCNAGHCKDVCGINHLHHAVDHKFIFSLRTIVGDSGKAVWQTIIKWGTMAIIALILIGLTYWVVNIKPG